MQDAVRRFPNSPAGLIQLAELNDLRGKYKEAAAIDREVLKPRARHRAQQSRMVAGDRRGQPEDTAVSIRPLKWQPIADPDRYARHGLAQKERPTKLLLILRIPSSRPTCR
jgi:hypothetical protein